MKKLNAFLVSVLSAAALNAAVIEQVIVRQQWPWSTDVKIEYKLSGVTVPVDISVRAYNGNVELDQEKVLSALAGDRYGIAEDGVGTLVLDPVKAFGTEKVALANFKVKLTVTEDSAMSDVLYKIVRISDGYVQNVTRADFHNGKMGSFETVYSKIDSRYSTSLKDVLIWTGVTNEVAYKTTHIVLRKINCKGVEWQMGQPSTEINYNSNAPLCSVVLTNDFWIGVFPITVGQWIASGAGNRTTSYGIYPEDTSARDVCPATGWRANIREKTSYSWPANRHKVHKDSLLGKLRATTGLDFELPTEAQWEFAVRGGNYAMPLYTGESITSWSAHQAALERIAWFDANTTYETVGSSKKRHWKGVGGRNPNAYGLYDMLGLLQENCLNRYYGYDTENLTCEPEGSDDTTMKYMVRSSTEENAYTNQRCGCRIKEQLTNNGMIGCRVILPENLVYPASEK